ncbi:MAG: sulfotransferase, partial [Burkholderiaceae bacterium]
SVPEDGATLQRLRAIYLEGIAARYPNRGLLTDKRPDNFLYIGLIKSMFPEARIVHTLRDPIDNCLSVYFLHLSHSMPYALDLLDTAHWYRQYKRLMAHWKLLYGDTIHDVDYDALVVEPRVAIQRLLDYCELPWQDTCLTFHKTKSVVMTPSAWQVREPLYTRSSGRWRRYARHLSGLRSALAAA